MQERGLLPGDYRDSGRTGRVGRGEQLTEEEKKELRQMRKRQRAEHRKKKILKLDDEGVSWPLSKTQFYTTLSWKGFTQPDFKTDCLKLAP